MVDEGEDARIVLRRWEPTAEDMAVAPAIPDLITWAAAQMILRNRTLIESNGQAAMEAVATAIRHGLAVPPWLATAFCEPLARFHRFEVHTLDEAFSVRPQAAKRIQTLRHRRSLLPVVCAALVDVIRSQPERPIDKGLFEEVGAVFNIGATHCEELYRSAVRKGEAQDLKAFKEVLAIARGSHKKPTKRSRFAGLHKRR